MERNQEQIYVMVWNNTLYMLISTNGFTGTIQLNQNNRLFYRNWGAD